LLFPELQAVGLHRSVELYRSSNFASRRFATYTTPVGGIPNPDKPESKGDRKKPHLASLIFNST
jgi:hypothetical protein